MRGKLYQEIDVLGTGVAAGFLTLAVTVVAVILSAVSNLLKWYWMIIGSLAVALCLVSIAAFVIWYLSRPVLARIDGLIERLVSENAMREAPWLITSDRLQQLESTTQATQIWIITRSMEEEIEVDLFGKVIKSNLERGVSYTYFIPDVPAILARVERMKDVYRSDRLIFKAISSPLFDLISAQDTAIFGALGSGSREMAGYMNLPIHEGGNSYFVVLGPQHCEGIVGTLSSLEARML